MSVVPRMRGVTMGPAADENQRGPAIFFGRPPKAAANDDDVFIV